MKMWKWTLWPSSLRHSSSDLEQRFSGVQGHVLLLSLEVGAAISPLNYADRVLACEYQRTQAETHLQGTKISSPIRPSVSEAG